MAQRRPHVLAAFADLGAALAAFALGAFGAPWQALAALIALHIGYWAYSRRRVLGRSPLARSLAMGAVAITLLIAIDAFVYLFALQLRNL